MSLCRNNIKCLTKTTTKLFDCFWFLRNFAVEQQVSINRRVFAGFEWFLLLLLLVVEFAIQQNLLLLSQRLHWPRMKQIGQDWSHFQSNKLIKQQNDIKFVSRWRYVFIILLHFFLYFFLVHYSFRLGGKLEKICRVSDKFWLDIDMFDKYWRGHN